MLKILQATLQQYVNRELPDVGDLRQLLRVPLRSQGHYGFGRIMAVSRNNNFKTDDLKLKWPQTSHPLTLSS